MHITIIFIHNAVQVNHMMNVVMERVNNNIMMATAQCEYGMGTRLTCLLEQGVKHEEWNGGQH